MPVLMVEPRCYDYVLSMNPAFELDQIHRYIDHLAGDPKQLGATVETHFFPVLQRIFIREGFEVQPDRALRARTFAFILKDLDLRRPLVAVDFAFQKSGDLTIIPSFAYDWMEKVENGPEAKLLLLRNAPPAPFSQICWV